MGIVVRFPRRLHARASSRDASLVSLSEVIPADLARLVESTAAQRGAGMLSRCHHLATAAGPTEISDANAAVEGQRSITSRKDRISVMRRILGPIVLNRKDNLTLDRKKFLGHDGRMADSEKDAFDQQFIARVAAARIATGLKQWQVADALGVPQDHYKHWEKKRVMPTHLIGRFCVICRIDPNWLLTGSGQKPIKAPQLVEQEPEPVRRPKRTKRTRAA